LGVGQAREHGMDARNKASNSATGSSARPAHGSTEPEPKLRPREVAQALRDAFSPEIQIVDTLESPETTVNAGLTGGRQLIDRTLVSHCILLAPAQGDPILYSSEPNCDTRQARGGDP